MDSRKLEYQKKIGKVIKQLREERGLTQAQLAKKAKINANYFAVIERGEVLTNNLNFNKIADVLGVDVSVITNPR